MARIQPFQMRTRSGFELTIRSARESDAEVLLTLLKGAIAEGTSQARETDEFKTTPSEKEIAITSRLEGSDDLLIVAEAEGRVVGYLEFHGHPNLRRLRHTGLFSIIVAQPWRGRGLGRALLEALLAWASAHPVIEKVSLLVFSTNAEAIALYKSLGFSEEGRRVRDIRLAPDRYADDVMMALWV